MYLVFPPDSPPSDVLSFPASDDPIDILAAKLGVKASDHDCEWWADALLQDEPAQYADPEDEPFLPMLAHSRNDRVRGLIERAEKGLGLWHPHDVVKDMAEADLISLRASRGPNGVVEAEEMTLTREVG